MMRRLYESVRIGAVRGELAGIEVCAALFTLGFEWGASYGGSDYVLALQFSNCVVLACFAFRVVLRGCRSPQSLMSPATVGSVLAVCMCLFLSFRIAAAAALICDVVFALSWIRRERPQYGLLVDLGHRPARSLLWSFVNLIAIGTVLLSFPAASAGSRVGLRDAFFTAVSAACVTGLVTVDTATTWSPFGQGVICLLFQLGGLGIMVVGAAMALSLGRGLGLSEDATVRGVFDEPDAVELRALLRNVVVWTLAIEGIGAAFLCAHFSVSMPFKEALLSAVFHAISAFCNAGFSLYSDSLTRFAADPIANAILMCLIVSGGLGFGVLMGLKRYVMTRSTLHLSVHLKLVMVTSAILLVTAFLVFFAFEYDRSLAHLSFGGKLVAAAFQGTTARTAGFSTVPLELMHPVTMLAMIVLMLIGASSGSTGGGLKTTTIAVVWLAIRAFIADRHKVEVFGRTIPSQQILRALALIGAGVLCYLVGLGLLLSTQSHSFEALAFETASALGTVGLSLGVTGDLTSMGQMVVCVLMFIGRVGPLTIGAAMMRRHATHARIQLPEGRVLVG